MRNTSSPLDLDGPARRDADDVCGIGAGPVSQAVQLCRPRIKRLTLFVGEVVPRIRQENLRPQAVPEQRFADKLGYSETLPVCPRGPP